MRIWCVLVILLPLAKQFASAAVELSSDAGTEVCSGTKVTFTCTASTDLVRWRYSGEAASQLIDITTGVQTLGPFVVAPVTGNVSFLISTATAAITEELNASLSCETANNAADSDSKEIPNVKGPPSLIPILTVRESTIVRVSANLWDFNLEWQVPAEDCNLEYVITPGPPPSLPCPANCTTQCHRFTLGQDDPRNFTVIAQNCGRTQTGNASEPLQVEFQLPDAPRNVWSRDIVYQKLDSNDPGELVSIMLTWSPVPDPKDPAPGVDGSITDYQISVTGIPPINKTKAELCTDEKCSYEVDVPKDGSTEYSVSVTARNVLGPGDITIVGPYNSSNNLLVVQVDYYSSISIAQVQCTFHSEQFISDQCTFEYWTDSNEHFYHTSSSQSEGTLQLFRELMPGTLYSYIVSASNDSLGLKVAVHGSFFTTDLGIEPPPTSNANLDEVSEDGRVATYSCDSALYELEGSCSIEYDEVNGWPAAPKCKAVGWIVLLIIVVILLAIAVGTLTAALMYCVRQRKKQVNLDAANLATPMETVEVKENVSYGPVRLQSQTAIQEPVYDEAITVRQPVDIRTGGNVAYGHVRP